jgi:hypothetical protein
MKGDRFFFTHKGQDSSFTKNARSALIKRSLAGVICDNTGIVKVKPNVFDVQSGTPIWDPQLEPPFGTPIWGPLFGTPIWDPHLGP